MIRGSVKPPIFPTWEDADIEHVDPGPEPDDGLLMLEEQPCMGSTLNLPSCGRLAEARSVRVRASSYERTRIIRDVPVCASCLSMLPSRLDRHQSVTYGTVSVPLEAEIDADEAYDMALREHSVREVMEA